MLNVKPTLAGVLTTAALFIASQIEGEDERAGPGPECATAQNDAAEAPSTLNQTVGATVVTEALNNKEVREWQRREARQRALELATGARTPHATAENIVEAAKRYETYLSNTEAVLPRANLGLATIEELIRELSKRTI